MTITVTAPPANQPPVVAAGADQELVATTSTVLKGRVRNDGPPKSRRKIRTKWTKASGPGTVRFTHASAANTAVAFGAPGTYVLRLQAMNGRLSASDDVTVTVTPGLNLAPRVSAGPDKTTQVSAAVALGGTASDDGRPKPPGKIKTTWTKVRGRGKVAFKDAADPDTLAKFSAPGVYVLRLTADDGGLQAMDDVTITVQ